MFRRAVVLLFVSSSLLAGCSRRLGRGRRKRGVPVGAAVPVSRSHRGK